MAGGGAQPNLSSNELMSKISIPIPPLPIQEAIVKILDNFSSLTAELQAELQARKSQYEFYRNQLLTFDREDAEPSGFQSDGFASSLKESNHLNTTNTQSNSRVTTTIRKPRKVKWMRLGDVCNLLTGFPFDSSQFKDKGIKLMRGINIKRGVLSFNENDDRYWDNISGLEKYLLKKDDIVISMDGSLVGKSFGVIEEKHLPLILVQRVARIRPSSGQVNIKYVYFCVTNYFFGYVEQKKTQGAIPHISLKDISTFEIPIPPLSEQQRIVSILDRFDTLINDISTGLPAEITARQQQYEYYRDKLLTFKRKG